MDEAVAAAIEDAFQERDVEGVEEAGPSWNENNRTVRVVFGDGQNRDRDRERNCEAYLKVAIDGDPSRIARERAALEYVDAHPEVVVSVPEVLAGDVDGEIPYLATAPLSGRAVSDRWTDWSVAERESTARLIGRTLADLHRIRFHGHGRVTGGGADGLEIRSTPWPEYLVETVEYVRELATTDRFDHHFEDAIAAIRANEDRLSDAPAVLVHGDVTRGNCFRREDADVVGLLDWEDAHAGDPVREIRRTERQLLAPTGRDREESVVRAFHEGYRERAGALPDGFEERQPIYAVVCFLDTSGFFDLWAPDADESTETLERWVETEMERRLAAL